MLASKCETKNKYFLWNSLQKKKKTLLVTCFKTLPYWFTFHPVLGLYRQLNGIWAMGKALNGIASTFEWLDW